MLNATWGIIGVHRYVYHHQLFFLLIIFFCYFSFIGFSFFRPKGLKRSASPYAFFRLVQHCDGEAVFDGLGVRILDGKCFGDTLHLLAFGFEADLV